MRPPRSNLPLRPIGPPRRGGGWRSLSPRRRFRLIRSGIILLTLIVLVWLLTSRCGGDDARTARTSSTTTRTEQTTSTVAPLMLTASLAAKPLPAPHYQAPAAVVGGRILVPGGLNRAKTSKNTVWSYDPVSGATTVAGTLVRAVYDSGAAPVGDALFVFGGGAGRQAFADVQSMWPGTDSKATPVGTLPQPRTGFATVSDPAGQLTYLVGGATGSAPALDVLSTLDGTTFQKVATLPEPVRSAAVALVGNAIFVFGGTWNDTATSSIQRVNLENGAAEVVAKLPAALSGAMAFTIDGTAFLAGGRVGGGRSNEIRRFDPATFTFTVVGALPANISDSSVAVVGRTAYLLGGLAPAPTAQVVVVAPAA